MAMVLAVLERRCQLKMYAADVYVSTVGGARVSDPSADLAAAIAVASAERGASVRQRVVAIGEVGLAGELRRVPGIERRLAEAARLGFTEAVIPAETRAARDRMTSVRHGLRVHAVPTLSHALQVLSIVPRAARSADPLGEAGGAAG
jgi:DNA repair protein RadA/Sms